MTEIGDQRFLLKHYKDTECNMLVFCSDVGLKILSKAKKWHSDGTFDSAPAIFYQLYLIHGMVGGRMFPAVYALLSGKSYNIYRKVKIKHYLTKK